MSECPWCGSGDVMDDGRGWWFCNDCPWGEDQCCPTPTNVVDLTDAADARGHDTRGRWRALRAWLAR